MRTDSNAKKKKIIIKPKLILHINHPFVLLLHKPHLFGLTQCMFYFNSFHYRYMRATCFDLYLGNPKACQYKKNCTKENTLQI